MKSFSVVGSILVAFVACACVIASRAPWKRLATAPPADPPPCLAERQGNIRVQGELQLRSERDHEGDVRSALALRGNYAAAVANCGRYEMKFDPHGQFGTVDFIDTLELLGRLSDLVVVGVAGDAVPYADPDGFSVVTDTNVRVTHQFKGRASKTVTVRVQGGRYRFEDGVEVIATPYEPYGLVPGERYALFLQLPERSRPDVGALPYSPTRGSPGIYQLSVDGKVFSQSLAKMPTKPMAEAYSVDEFLARMPAWARGESVP